MRIDKKCPLLLISIFLVCGLLYAEIEIYFAPDGGFSPRNNERTIVLKGEKVPANLNNTLLELIEHAESGSTLKIAMYAFGFRPMQDALIDAARRGVKIKLVMDAIADWTQEIRSEFKTRILSEYELAKKENRPFEFQFKEIYAQAMIDRGRMRKTNDGTTIYGTMHEKFGIIYPKGCSIPLHGFCGSANISWSASHVFAENRVIFKNEPSMGRQLAEEFSRLWNEFGTPVTDNCQSENFLPVQTNLGEVQILSNSKPLDEENFQRIDEALMKMMESVDRQSGTIDVAMFSFTHLGLINKLLELAERCPQIKVRILMDQTQLEDDENHQGVLGPYMERQARFKDLKNFEIRYKWRSNTYAWDPEANRCQLIHWRNLLLHHKCMIVNRKRMGLGSYNWSESGEFRNFENVMFFNGDIPTHKNVVDRFLDEFEFMWNTLKKEGPVTAKIPNPQVVTGDQGMRLKKKIVSAFNDPDCKKIMATIDATPSGCSEKNLAKICGIEEQKLREKTKILEEATLIFSRQENEEMVYHVMD